MTDQNQASSAPTILQKIYAQRARDVEKAKSTPGTTPADLQAQLDMNLAPPLIDVVERLRRNPSTFSADVSTHIPSLMAEIKRASPSKGPIAPTVNVAAQAQAYALGGASLISVLTEPTWFLGSLMDMRLAREILSTLPDRPAVLRKDFILDEYQIDEARLWGADCVLLIVAMLDDERLSALYAYSRRRGMEPLVEVNNEEEMKRALALDGKLIGVNNRNLHSFDVDMSTTSRLSTMLTDHPQTILCALSGISSPEDITKYAAEGVRGVLIGESLMRAQDPSAFIRTLFNWPSQPSRLSITLQKLPWVKIDGIRTEEEALFFADRGVELIGLNFDPKDPRCVESTHGEVLTRSIREHRPAITERTGPMPIVPAVSDAPLSAAEPEENMNNAPWFTRHVRQLVCLARKPLVIGIFKDQLLSTIIRIVYAAQLDLVELTGSEPLEWATQIPVPVIRRINVDALSQHSTEKLRSEIKQFLRPGLHAYLSLSGSSTDAIRSVLSEGEVPGWAGPVITGHARPRVDGDGTAEVANEGEVASVDWALQFEYEDEEGGFETFNQTLQKIRKLQHWKTNRAQRHPS